jgi:hypothetical protein
MESGIHALSRSETAQAEPNAATITAIAEAPAQRDRFRNLLLNPDDMIVLQSHCPQIRLEAPKFAAAAATPSNLQDSNGSE